MYRYADKYGANVDGYSPIYTPDTWSESGECTPWGQGVVQGWCLCCKRWESRPGCGQGMLVLAKREKRPGCLRQPTAANSHASGQAGAQGNGLSAPWVPQFKRMAR